MRSPRRVLYERIFRRGDERHRYVDVGLQVRVYRCTCGLDHAAATPAQLKALTHEAAPAELLPRVYGGRYDSWERGYVGPPQKIVEVEAHPGQVPFLTYESPPGEIIDTVWALGAQGGGKTFGLVRRAGLDAAEMPNLVLGITGPTQAKRDRIWDDFITYWGPLGFIDEIIPSELVIYFVNRVRFEFVALKEASRQTGTPAQGQSWYRSYNDEWQNATPAARKEVSLRGRRAGRRYRMWCTATNQLLPGFQEEHDRVRRPGSMAVVLPFSGYTNAFVDPYYWEMQRPKMSAADFDRMMGGDPPIEGVIHHAFQALLWKPDGTGGNLRRQPELARDITAQLVEHTWPRQVEYRGRRIIIGHDPGKLVNASEWLQAFSDPEDPKGRLWWSVGELVTYERTSQQHASLLTAQLGERGYTPRDAIVVMDPHVDKTNVDASDFVAFQKAGFLVVWGSGAKIPRKHRWAMANALFRDGSREADGAQVGKQRWFIDVDAYGNPLCPEIVKCLKFYRLGRNGEPEQHNKTKDDPSHPPDGAEYGLWRWEHLRGVATPLTEQDKLPLSKMERALRGVHGTQGHLR